VNPRAQTPFRFAFVLLLCAACGKPEAAAAKERTFPARGVESLTVAKAPGALTVRNGPPDQVGVTWSGEGAVLKVEKRDATLHLPDGAEGDLVITAPPGIRLMLIARREREGQPTTWGKVRIEGGWGTVVAVGGTVDADVERIEGGSLKAMEGAATLRARVSGPTVDLTCEAVGAGDASVRVPAAWRGRIHLSSQLGKTEIQQHAGLRATVEPSGKSILAFAGAPLTDEERKAELADGGSRQAIWVKTARGTASFALED